jgi:DNA modification methylase
LEILAREVELVAVDAVQPHPRNPRKGSLPGIAESIRVNGFYGAIVAQRSTGHILAGNHRYQAAVAEGITEIPVMWLDVDDERATKIMLADNRTSDLGTYDDELLAALLADMEATSEGLLGTGYDDAALRALIGGTVGLTDPDEVPDPPTKPTTQLGDLWQLGEHRLLCGDATDPAALERVCEEGRGDLTFTDPPWNVAIGTDKNPKHRQRAGLANDDLPPDEFSAFLSAAIRNIRDFASGDIYCVLGAAEWPTLDKAMRDSGLHWSATLVWAKDTFVLGRSNYHRRYEPIWYGWRKGERSSFVGGRSQDDVWEIDRPKVSAEHPTMKPVELVERAIVNSSRVEARVLDPFMGSGTTLIAAERQNRVALGIELDPGYCDVIVQRWQNFTGDKARRVRP